MMTNRKGKFKVKNGSGSYDQVMLETQLGQVLDSPIKSLERNTYYEQNDVVAEQTCKGAFLVCVEGGTTDASLPPYSGALEGAPVIDGTAIFTVHRFNNLANTDAITAHDALETAHPSLDFIKSMSAASDGIHYRTRNGKSDQVLDLINKLQATLSQGTVPSGNTGSLAALLSGIVHQIKALSGKSNWWETPKDSFETLSAGVVAGDVSNDNAWWVKLGGAVPLIIQGGIGNQRVQTISFPVAFSKCLSIQITQLWNSEDEKYTCRVLWYGITNFRENWGHDWDRGPDNKRYMWLAIGC